MEFSLRPERRPAPYDAPDPIPDFVIDDEALTLYIDEPVVSGMREHAKSDPDREVGGLLLGRHMVRGNRVVVMVTGHRPVPSRDRGPLHFSFADEEALNSVHAIEQSREKYVVGWFHSHPRMGDPFMSGADLVLHRKHFREPWHISCVVAVGEWAMPIGFWRVLDQQLCYIDRYHISMTTGEVKGQRRGRPQIGESMRRLMRSATEDEPPLDTALSALECVLPRIGFDGAELVREIREESRPAEGGRSPRPFGWFGVLSRAAARVAGNPQQVELARRINERLGRTRFVATACRRIVSCPELRNGLSINGNLCVAINRDEPELMVCDFARRLYVPVGVGGIDGFVSHAWSSSGGLAILGSGGRVAWSPGFKHVCSSLLDGRSPELSFGFTQKPEGIGETLSEIYWDGGDLIALGESSLFRFGAPPAESIGTSEGPPVTREPIPPARLCAVRGPLESFRGILHRPAGHGGANPTLEWWPGGQDAPIPLALPEDMALAEIQQACWFSLGLAVQVRIGDEAQVCMFNGADGSLRAVLLDEGEGGGDGIRAIAVDPGGRLFVVVGNSVQLLNESGSPEVEWIPRRGS